MKLRRVLAAACALAGSALAFAAAPLTRDASVYAQPNPAAPVLKVLPAGTVPAPAPAAVAPEGWMAVTVTGPLEVWVPNKLVNKELAPKPGAPFHAKPDATSPVVGTMEPTDAVDLGRLTADFTGFTINKPVVGYVKLGLATPAPVAAPVAPTPYPTVPAASAAVGSETSSLRFYEGRFAPTRNFLGFKHPYNFQLLDQNGQRFAYLDVSRLTLTDKVELYFDRLVIVYGVVRRVENTSRKEIVLEVERMHLK